MKNKLFKFVLVLLCIPLVTTASIDPKLHGKFTKEKTIKKQFDVSSDALLKLKNSYGNLHITSWDKNTTTIEVHIQTSSDNEKKAQQRLDQISVDFQATNTTVSAQTIFSNNRWRWGGDNVSIQVNYTVKVPVGNKLDLSNDYGTIYLNQINGSTKIKCDYGSMKLGKLNATLNEISFDYTSNVSVDYINGATINADYSNFTIHDAKKIELEADYSNSIFNNVELIDFSCDYGDVIIENVGKVIGSGDYLTTRIERVEGSVDIEGDYGGIKIKEITPKAGNITIDGDYTNVEIGYSEGYHFDITATLEYTDFKYDNNIEFSIKREKSSESYYQGYHGSKGKNSIKIDIEYGGLKMLRR